MLTSEERIKLIKNRVNDALSPKNIEVIDDSADHIGHAGAASGAGHFTVIVVSEAFRGKTPVQCHRLVYDAIGDAMGGEIHALRINAKAPE